MGLFAVEATAAGERAGQYALPIGICGIVAFICYLSCSLLQERIVDRVLVGWNEKIWQQKKGALLATSRTMKKRAGLVAVASAQAADLPTRKAAKWRRTRFSSRT